ncbi:MAG: hypothetical protein OIF34_12590, partial [Porticoccaceae bacterium]|nr:hypothetical protein [Porticoccaceae bacterium]
MRPDRSTLANRFTFTSRSTFINRTAPLLLAASIATVSGYSQADGTLTPTASWADNLRFAVDLSSRVSHFDHADETGYTNVAGIDLHKVFSSTEGDIGTLIVQLYWTRIDNLIMRPGFFDGPDDSELVYRIVNFNWTALGPQAPHIRVGHFEIPDR